MGRRMMEIATTLAGLGRKTTTMADILKNVKSEMTQQKKDMSSDVGKLELKYLKECALGPIQVW